MRRIAATLIILFCASGAALAQVDFTIIEGNPLTIHVGADNSFQVFNADVPGVGQIFPSSCENTADMGVFAEINGTLFAPAFSNHGCGTATSNLAENTPWTMEALSEVTGAGTFESPFNVGVTTSAGTTGLRMVMQVQYVNGQNFFRIIKRLVSFSSLTARMWVGADIFLAGSDAGDFFVEPTLSAPGGTDCADPPTYTILIIPVTAADKFTAAVFSEVWSQIGQGDLNNTVSDGQCLDNGAAIQWDRTFNPGDLVSLRSAISFGTIPDPANFARFSIRADPFEFTTEPGTTLNTTITTARHDEAFNFPLTLEIGEPLPTGITATLTSNTIPAPGEGSVGLRITISDAVLPGTHVIRVAATGDGERWATAVTIHVTCDPPFILGLDEPGDQSVRSGSSARLSVKPSGSGPFRFQWFLGPQGSTFFPIAGGTGPDLTLPSVLSPTFVWVRVSNICGSADSRTVAINVTP